MSSIETTKREPSKSEMQRWLIYRGGFNGSEVLNLTTDELAKEFKKSKGKRKVNLPNIDFKLILTK